MCLFHTPKSTNSISKSNVAHDSTFGANPSCPYPYSGAIINRANSPLCIVPTPISHPKITLPSSSSHSRSYCGQACVTSTYHGQTETQKHHPSHQHACHRPYLSCCHLFSSVLPTAIYVRCVKNGSIVQAPNILN